MTDADVSQDGLAVVGQTNPDARVSQDGLAVVGDPGPDARVAQDGLAVVGDPGPDAQVAQDGLAVVGDPGPDAQVWQFGLVLIGRPRILRTPPSSELVGVGYADLVLHTVYVIDETGDPVVTGGDTVVDSALDTVIDLAGDTLEGNDNYVVARSYWT